MTVKYSKHVQTRKRKAVVAKATATPQNVPIPGRKREMALNRAGGYVFQVDSWQQMKRFLILGTEAGTYYAGEREMTVENAKNVIACVKKDGVRAVRLIVDTSVQGNAPKNDPAIFALALAVTHGDTETKALAYTSIVAVCRTGTHLFQFCEMVGMMRGWSRGLRTGVATFYTMRQADDLARQLLKYRQREGWTHRDVLRLTHPKAPARGAVQSLLKYAVGKAETAKSDLVKAYEELKALGAESFKDGRFTNLKDGKRALKLIVDHGMTWEMVPTDMLATTIVWETLLPGIPLTACMRNLGRMSANGLLMPGSDAAKMVNAKLSDVEALKKARIHPMAVLMALRTYQQGRGVKGKLTWTAVQSVVDTLNDAFYQTFQNVQPTGKDWLLGVDISGSMSSAMVSNSPLSAAELAAAMALVTLNVEKNTELVAFNTGTRELKIGRRSSLAEATSTIVRMIGGGTDCSAPIHYAKGLGMKVDVFGIYTDSETWAGRQQPAEALTEYRRRINKDAKLINVAMTATKGTIGDVKDPGVFEVVGFDTAAPQMMSRFVSGDFDQ